MGSPPAVLLNIKNLSNLLSSLFPSKEKEKKLKLEKSYVGEIPSLQIDLGFRPQRLHQFCFSPKFRECQNFEFHGKGRKAELGEVMCGINPKSTNRLGISPAKTSPMLLFSFLKGDGKRI